MGHLAALYCQAKNITNLTRGTSLCLPNLTPLLLWLLNRSNNAVFGDWQCGLMVACLSVIFTAPSPSLISRRTKKKTVFSMAMGASGKYPCYSAGAEEQRAPCLIRFAALLCKPHTSWTMNIGCCKFKLHLCHGWFCLMCFSRAQNSPGKHILTT